MFHILSGLSGVSYADESIALFARMLAAGSEPDAARKTVIDTCIKALKTANAWTKHDALWFPAAHSQVAGNLNWLDAGHTLVPKNACTWLTDRHYAGNGIDMWVDTSFNPSTEGSNYTLNDAFIWVYIRNNLQQNTVEIGSSTNASIQAQRAAGLSRTRINDATSTDVALPANNSQGLTLLNRKNATTFQLFKNGSQCGADVAKASTFITNYNFGLLCRNATTPASFSNMQIAAAGVGGGGITPTQILDMFTAVEAYLDAIGAGVV